VSDSALFLGYWREFLNAYNITWLRGLRCRSAVARLLRLWVRIPPEAWLFVCCQCCVLSGRGLCDELITLPEESYCLCCVVVCDLETSWMMEEAMTHWGLLRQKQMEHNTDLQDDNKRKLHIGTECGTRECFLLLLPACLDTKESTRFSFRSDVELTLCMSRCFDSCYFVLWNRIANILWQLWPSRAECFSSNSRREFHH
jgi:hypothetical protein